MHQYLIILISMLLKVFTPVLSVETLYSDALCFSNSTLSDFMLSAPHSPCWEPLCHYNWPTQVRALLFHEESVKHLAAHHWGTRVGLQVRRSGEISLSGDSCAET